MWLGGVWSRCGLFEGREGLRGGNELERERDDSAVV